MGQSQSNPAQVGEAGQLYRKLADRDGNKRRELSQKSQEAWAAGDRAKAKQLSLAAKVHGESMECNNALAAAEIFAVKNPHYFVPASSSPFSFLSALLFSAPTPHTTLARIDLHWLRVNEALEKVREHLVLCQKHGVRRTTIITGRGLHSQDGVAKIRPVVEQLLRESRVCTVSEGRGNEGAFVVEMLGEGEGEAKGLGGWLWKSLFG